MFVQGFRVYAPFACSNVVVAVLVVLVVLVIMRVGGACNVWLVQKQTKTPR